MFELLSISEDKKYGRVFDSDDFSVEMHPIDDIVKYLVSGVKIRGISLDKNRNIICRDTEKFLIYNDDKFAFLNAYSDINDYQNNISVLPLHGKVPCYSFGYNMWIEKNKDVIIPKVIKRTDNIYEISLFGKNIGFSVCVMDVGNKILKPIYRDSRYVYKDSKLIIDDTNIKRDI